MHWKRALPAGALAGILHLLTAMAAAGEVSMKIGRQLFTEDAQPACGICHTLQHAGTSGTVGPNLDALKPDRDKVAAAVRKGVGAMPAYAEQLSAQEIEALAVYVSRSVRCGE
jgi:cytochrome c6